jgi:hypothetical protein
MIVRSAGDDKPHTPTDDVTTPDSNNKSQGEGVNIAIIVVSIVVPVLVVIVSAVILIACLVKRNKKISYSSIKYYL